MTKTLTFAQSWNLIAMPVEPMETMLVEDRCQLIISQKVSADQAVKWNESLGSWSAHLCGRTSNNFALDLTHAYFVRVTGAGGEVGFTGWAIQEPQMVAGMVVGWNLIAVPYPGGYYAESLGQAIIADGISASQVVRWNESLGTWSAHLVGRTSNDFPIQLGHGYFVRVTVVTGTGEFAP